MTTPTSSRMDRPVGTTVASGLVGVAVAAAITGALAPLALSDPGPLVRWGVPVASTVATIASSAAVGLLLMAAFVVPERTTTNRRSLAVRCAAAAAAIWAAAAFLELFLGFADLAGSPLTEPGLFSQFTTFVWTLETTRILLLSTTAAVVVAVAARFTSRRAPLAWLALLGLSGVLVQSLTGHAAGSTSHEDAVNALLVHLLGVVPWVGGLIALVVLRGALGRDLGASVARYSVLAGWCFVLVALSGIQQAWIRLGSLAGLGTAYGVVVLLKSAAILVLGGFGWLHRRNIVSRLGADPSDGRAFARLAVGELVVMGAATGLAAVLARTPPPVPDALPDPSRVLELTGFPDPGPVAGADWITAWRVEWLFLGIAVLAVGLYLAGVLRLHRRGDAWPIGRTICWVLGWALFVYATCGAPGIWGRVLFSVHMVMHMIVAMTVPLLLVPGAPLTLALRALPVRKDRTWGPRELILQVVHSRAMRLMSNPVIAAALFFFSLAAFYWSGLFEIALVTHTGHLLMIAHFLLTGYLFTWVLIGIDPGPPRWSPPILLVILFATISFHAFFGVALAGSDTLLAPGFFEQINLPWGPDLLYDQQRAGQIAWGVSEFPTLVLAVIVAVQWFRTDEKETRRMDRQADRDGDAELKAYNARLAQLRQEAERH
ncbi:MAG: bifunctional copper resistance protein CopD/cytochrome c oxidase assembly protein [Ornithinibacter sp.]